MTSNEMAPRPIASPLRGQRLLVLLLVAALAVVTVPTLSRPAEAAGDTPNILVLIADDFGVESSVCYDDLPAPAPRLEGFCDDAVVFDNVWSSPICSPTRAGILTGRHSFRTGITEQATGANNLEIDDDEYTLPRVLDLAGSGYATANFGKWHLGGGNTKPNDMGWDHFSGLLAGGLSDYENWTKVTNGTTSPETTYATTANVNDALGWIGAQTDPWLTWIGFNAPHTPFHDPPGDLHTQDLAGASQLDQYHAAVEALDTEIGRLIDSLDPETLDNTVIIFMGDNGNPAAVSEYGRGSAKGTITQGGIHVPMMVWGAGVEDGGRRSDALVGTIDVFATVLELAGVDARAAVPSDVEFDSRSFVSVLEGTDDGSKDYLLAHVSGTLTADRREGTTIRDDRYKLIDYTNRADEFYDLQVDPTGSTPIAAADRTASEDAAHDDLVATLAAWIANEDSPSPNPFPDVADDTTPPTTSIDEPSHDGTVNGDPLVITGSATDDTGVARVRLAMVDTATGSFLQADGTFGTVRYFADADLDTAGAAATDWTWSGAVPDGRYRLIAKSDDASGNVESAVRQTFDVESSAPDTTPPSSTITDFGDAPVGATTLSGDATDDVGVDQVRISLRNRDNQLWLQDDGTFAAAWNGINATLTDPDAAATGWDIDVTLPEAGRYRLIAKATDTSDNGEDPPVRLDFVAS